MIYENRYRLLGKLDSWSSTSVKNSLQDELNILPLGSYDCLIRMDWLD